MDRIEEKICQIIDSKKDEIMAFGRDIFCHAELGYKEHRTSQKFVEEMENWASLVRPAWPSPA